MSAAVNSRASAWPPISNRWPRIVNASAESSRRRNDGDPLSLSQPETASAPRLSTESCRNRRRDDFRRAIGYSDCSMRYRPVIIERSSFQTPTASSAAM